LTKGHQTLNLSIPAEFVTNGLNEIQLHFEQIFPVASTRTDVTVVSAGEEGGSLGHIYLNGVDVSTNRRGYNLALIHPNGDLLATANFDTFCQPETGGDCPANASHELAAFITTAPPEMIVAGAAADEASSNLTEEAVNAFRSIGVQVDLRGQFRASHAFIVDQANSQVLEEYNSLQQPIKLTTGLGLVEPNIAAVFASITFEAQP
jgi:hypothetical protein